jgi:hypothetical protein
MLSLTIRRVIAMERPVPKPIGRSRGEARWGWSGVAERVLVAHVIAFDGVF